jgi:hypothetical protein
MSDHVLLGTTPCAARMCLASSETMSHVLTTLLLSRTLLSHKRVSVTLLCRACVCKLVMRIRTFVFLTPTLSATNEMHG